MNPSSIPQPTTPDEPAARQEDSFDEEAILDVEPVLSDTVRGSLVGVALLLLSVFGVAAWLNPYEDDGSRRANGTHQQLGLGECGFLKVFLVFHIQYDPQADDEACAACNGDAYRRVAGITGTGLGLAIAREVIRLHGAMLRAGSSATHLAISTPNGHDAFLVDYPLITPPVRDFLSSL